MLLLARRNLLSEAGRFAISIGGVAFAVLLILLVIALYRGWSETGSTFALLPGEVWVTQSGTVDPFHSSSSIGVEHLDALDSIPGVQGVTPVLGRLMTFEGEGVSGSFFVLALGLEDQGSPLDEDARAFLPPPGEISIDRVLARKHGLDEGTNIRLGDRELQVGQITSGATEALTQFAFVNYADARAAFGVRDVVNYVTILLHDDTASGPVMHAIEADLNLEAFSSAEFAESARSMVDDTFVPVIAVLTAVGFVVGVAVVGLTAYAAAIERTREFGVLKAVGASGLDLYRIVIAQSLFVTIPGFIAGAVLAWAVAGLAEQLVPDFATNFQVLDAFAVFLSTLAMAVAASAVPVRRVNGIDPGMVFRA